MKNKDYIMARQRVFSFGLGNLFADQHDKRLTSGVGE